MNKWNKLLQVVNEVTSVNAFKNQEQTGKIWVFTAEQLSYTVHQ